MKGPKTGQNKRQTYASKKKTIKRRQKSDIKAAKKAIKQRTNSSKKSE